MKEAYQTPDAMEMPSGIINRLVAALAEVGDNVPPVYEYRDIAPRTWTDLCVAQSIIAGLEEAGYVVEERSERFTLAWGDDVIVLYDADLYRYAYYAMLRTFGASVLLTDDFIVRVVRSLRNLTAEDTVIGVKMCKPEPCSTTPTRNSTSSSARRGSGPST